MLNPVFKCEARRLLINKVARNTRQGAMLPIPALQYQISITS
jgi:hypothetical protein